MNPSKIDQFIGKNSIYSLFLIIPIVGFLIGLNLENQNNLEKKVSKEILLENSPSIKNYEKFPENHSYLDFNKREGFK